MVYNVETTTQVEEAATLSVVNDAETTTHTEEAVTQSVVNDVETTTHTEEAVTQSLVNDAETTTHTDWPQQPHLELALTIAVAWDQVAEIVRTQILWLKQPMICDVETTYNISNKKTNK